MDLYQLKTFFYLAQIKNYSMCAQKLFVTQSAISHSIKKLEESIGYKLIDKSGKSFSLTHEGKILFKTCEKVFYEIESAQEKLKEIKGKKSVVRIGSQVEFGLSILINQINEFNKHNPKIHVDFKFSNNPLPLLIKNEIDIMIDCKHHLLPDLDHYTLFREEYVVIATSSYVKSRSLKSPKDLKNCNILSLDKEANWWNNFFHSISVKEHVDFQEVTEINHIRGIINASKLSMGVGFVPKYSVLKELKSGELVNTFPEIHFQEDHFELYILRKKAAIAKNKCLIEFLRNIKPAEFN